MGKGNKAILKGIANLAIVFAGIQLSPLISPASQNKLLAFIIPVVVLVFGVILLEIEES